MIKDSIHEILLMVFLTTLKLSTLYNVEDVLSSDFPTLILGLNLVPIRNKKNALIFPNSSFKILIKYFVRKTLMLGVFHLWFPFFLVYNSLKLVKASFDVIGNVIWQLSLSLRNVVLRLCCNLCIILAHFCT